MPNGQGAALLLSLPVDKPSIGRTKRKHTLIIITATVATALVLAMFSYPVCLMLNIAMRRRNPAGSLQHLG